VDTDAEHFASLCLRHDQTQRVLRNMCAKIQGNDKAFESTLKSYRELRDEINQIVTNYQN
jgi:hypothetical protein